MTSKKGFTLIEMIITIALILVLTTVFTATLTTYITKSQAASGQVESHLNKYDAAQASVAALRGGSGGATSVPSVVPGSFLVTFADWDGTVITTQSVISGGTATAPANPVRAGHTFNGWNPSTFTNITADLAVIATYTAASYTVDFVDWNGTVLKTETVGYGSAATAPAEPTRAGYTFAGWNPSDFSNIIASQTVTAQYTGNTYKVTFKNWDGAILSEVTVAYGGTATAPANPTRTGYTFTGWSPSVFSNITAPMTVNAQYSINTYKVTFKNWDGATLKEEMVNYGGSATAPTSPTREGYVFTGWSPSVYTNVTAPLTVTAQYSSPITGVSISGTVRFGSVLTAVVTPSGATVSYQWSRASTASGTYTNVSTGSTYTLGLNDVAKYIKVTVVGIGTYTGTATSGSVGPVTKIALTGVTATGTANRGATLTAAVTPAGATVTYQWKVASSLNGTYTNPSNGTSATYTIPNSYSGKYIKVVVTGTGGYSGTVTSVARGPVG